MTTKIVAPSIKLKAFNCPRCGALADQSWFKILGDSVKETPFVQDSAFTEHIKSLPAGEGKMKAMHEKFVSHAEKAMTGEIFFKDESSEYAYPLENLFMSQCRSCKDLTLWHHDTILYPLAQYEIQPNEDLSDDIKADFNEARTILDLSPRGAAALLRLCIQKLCKHLGQPGKNINDDIAALVAAGLDPKIQRALDIVRVIGNECVHPGTMDLKDDRETAAKLFQLVNRIAYDMITHPKEVDALYNALPADKLDGINKRDAKASLVAP